MRKLMFAGLALSAAAMAVPRPAAAQASESKAWCTIESGNTRECYWDTKEQCAETKQHLQGGSCFRNPFYHAEVPPGRAAPVRAYRAVVHNKHVSADR